MHEPLTFPLEAWEAFYVIVGSSAAALTGLQFVVIALVAEARRRSTLSEIDAFGTPTVVHFCAVLLISANLSAPWTALRGAGFLLDFCGLAGVGYVVLVIRRARRQSGYSPVFEDWLWHAVLPALAYAALLVASATIAAHPTNSLFVIGGVALLLLFIGIHNAWDSVKYVAVARQHAPPEPPEESAPPGADH